MNEKINDRDPTETKEWLDALNSIIRVEGAERAHFILDKLLQEARRSGAEIPFKATTAYVNTLPPEKEAPIPSDGGAAKHLSAVIRWNAMVMVLRAQQKVHGVGGHIASYASVATLWDVGFNYFFHGVNDQHGGDLIYFQGHSSPGIYARAFLEGRLTEAQLDNFRQEVEKDGLSSYPHPWLMPNFWQFPTVSMGLGPISAVYQARFLKYLEHRELAKTSGRKVWAYCGDGEMDEPESRGAISLAAREQLDNLIFVVNCNLQRLDGPVRGNSSIIQELEGFFRGAGWNVIKVLWGSNWDPLLARDHDGLLVKRMEEAVDGDYQNYRARDGAYIREHFFGKYPELLKMVEHMTDDEIWQLRRGGHDSQKVYAAYQAAVEHTGQPTVILAKTIKGFGMGGSGEGLNITHQQKKMAMADLLNFRDRFGLPLTDEQVQNLTYYKPADDSPEMQFLHERNKVMGDVPARRIKTTEQLAVPPLSAFHAVTEGSADREMSTMMAFIRILNLLVKDKIVGARIVPICPDESRTFGMEGMFRQLGIYSAQGQLYTPVDADQVMYYHEDKKGQILEEGICEAGATCSWIAAGTSYSSNNFTMIPFYIFYSMFGFQRVGDLIWAGADQQTRGFLMGGTSGRTTMHGEGLQHNDGSSHVIASTFPNCIAYDPTYAYELAVIIQDGLRRMVANQENIFYYITIMNENYQQPAMPKDSAAGILKGMYLLQAAASPEKLQVNLLGSGAILREVIKAAEWLKKDFKVSAAVWSVTSFTELRREALEVEHYNRLHPTATQKQSYVTQCLQKSDVPVIAVSDYVKLLADGIRTFVPAHYVTLGTDGFGRSDSREALRYFFEVNAEFIVVATLKALAEVGKVPAATVEAAIKKYKINPDKPNPVNK